MSWRSDIRAVVGLALHYDDKLEKISEWGLPALSKRPNRKKRNNKPESKPVELFKLHLGNLQEHLKPKLTVEYKKAITDYLREIGNLIKDTVTTTWPGIDYSKNVMLVLTVPAEYSDKAKAIMRECALNAGLLSDKLSEKLQFTTEPEAAAIYCMDSSLKEHDLAVSGTTFMIVDCGGGTVDLTTQKLLEEKQLGEITERAGDYCGSTFIDKEFIKYLRDKLGDNAIDLLEENHYGQMQYMIQEFCKNAKLPFTGEDLNFNYEMDLEEVSPVLLQYVTGDINEALEEAEWLIKLDFETIKSMFDPIVERILRMISAQLDNSREKCSAMFLVGGFSQSKYLQKRIKEEFDELVGNISVPSNPIAAISRGAAIYGISLNNADNYCSDGIKCIISSRVLKFTYGIRTGSKWKKGDPKERRTFDGYIQRFSCVARRGTNTLIEKPFTLDHLTPHYPFQTVAAFQIFYTREYDAEFCDEDGMELLGTLKIDLPDSHLGCNRPISFGLKFGKMEVTATARNNTNGQNYQTTFEIETDE
ncbi:6284_t:CDS:2 [Funneliformis geosporum]|uniref:11031_t:CDS:1 n=1 Tax=Funneliformis geosporum TaxID=1117311 RepID=A0A9W4SMN3_9GLOM|nr:11031_t:CDS:2 [Funneliformis geosporum]CAI2174836.1 6284_t:CDS:2 [Funneliformis geosporum]